MRQAKENPARQTLGTQSLGYKLSASILAHHGVSVTVPATGKYVRFNDKGRMGSGPLWAYCDGIHGAHGDWRSGESVVVSMEDELDPTQAAEARRRTEEAKRQYEQERKERQEQTAAKCHTEWPTLSPADPKHPYLVVKCIQSHNIRQAGTSLVIPLSDGDRLVNWQTIGPDGFKRFRSGGRITGCYSPLGTITSGKPLLICEGWATAASLHETTGLPVAAAMNAGNLLPVCESFRRRYRAQRIVVAADNDHVRESQGKGNAGLTKGREAARFIGAGLIHPPAEQGISDFNDWLRAGGSVEL